MDHAAGGDVSGRGARDERRLTTRTRGRGRPRRGRARRDIRSIRGARDRGPDAGVAERRAADATRKGPDDATAREGPDALAVRPLGRRRRRPDLRGVPGGRPARAARGRRRGDDHARRRRLARVVRAHGGGDSFADARDGRLRRPRRGRGVDVPDGDAGGHGGAELRARGRRRAARADAADRPARVGVEIESTRSMDAGGKRRPVRGAPVAAVETPRRGARGTSREVRAMDDAPGRGVLGRRRRRRRARARAPRRRGRDAARAERRRSGRARSRRRARPRRVLRRRRRRRRASGRRRVRDALLRRGPPRRARGGAVGRHGDGARGRRVFASRRRGAAERAVTAEVVRATREGGAGRRRGDAVEDRDAPRVADIRGVSGDGGGDVVDGRRGRGGRRGRRRRRRRGRGARRATGASATSCPWTKTPARRCDSRRGTSPPRS